MFKNINFWFRDQVLRFRVWVPPSEATAIAPLSYIRQWNVLPREFYSEWRFRRDQLSRGCGTWRGSASWIFTTQAAMQFVILNRHFHTTPQLPLNFAKFTSSFNIALRFELDFVTGSLRRVQPARTNNVVNYLNFHIFIGYQGTFLRE